MKEYIFIKKHYTLLNPFLISDLAALSFCYFALLLLCFFCYFSPFISLAAPVQVSLCFRLRQSAFLPFSAFLLFFLIL